MSYASEKLKLPHLKLEERKGVLHRQTELVERTKGRRETEQEEGVLVLAG